MRGPPDCGQRCVKAKRERHRSQGRRPSNVGDYWVARSSRAMTMCLVQAHRAPISPVLVSSVLGLLVLFVFFGLGFGLGLLLVILAVGKARVAETRADGQDAPAL